MQTQHFCVIHWNSFLNNIQLTPGALPCMFKTAAGWTLRHRGRSHCAHSEGRPCPFVSFLRPYSSQHPKYHHASQAETAATLEVSRAHWSTFSNICARVCVCACVCARTRMYACMCIQVCAGVSGSQSWYPNFSTTFVLGLRSLSEPEAHQPFQLASPTPKLTSINPQEQGYRCLLPTGFLHACWRSELRSLCWCDKYFTY